MYFVLRLESIRVFFNFNFTLQDILTYAAWNKTKKKKNKKPYNV